MPIKSLTQKGIIANVNKNSKVPPKRKNQLTEETVYPNYRKHKMYTQDHMAGLGNRETHPNADSVEKPTTVYSDKPVDKNVSLDNPTVYPNQKPHVIDTTEVIANREKLEHKKKKQNIPTTVYSKDKPVDKVEMSGNVNADGKPAKKPMDDTTNVNKS